MPGFASGNPKPRRYVPSCVLLVDDEPMIRNAASRILARLGCQVMVAKNGAEAVSIYRASQDIIDVVILDLGMPVMNGIECLAILKSINPCVQVIISSGYMDDAHSEIIREKGAAGMLPKPYDAGALASIFRCITI